MADQAGVLEVTEIPRLMDVKLIMRQEDKDHMFVQEIYDVFCAGKHQLRIIVAHDGRLDLTTTRVLRRKDNTIVT